MQLQYNGYIHGYAKNYSELEEDTKRRYDDKLKISGCLKDPYCYLERKNRGKNNISRQCIGMDWLAQRKFC